MRFADVVAASAAVGGEPSRTAKVRILAGLLAAAGPDEVGEVVAWLSGDLRQGRIGIGWATLGELAAVHAVEPSLEVADVAAAIEALAGVQGAGSVSARRAALEALWARATEAEARFLGRLLLGELRQGALEGVMVEAVGRAGRIPVATVRRAVMLSGDLSAVAALAAAGGAGALDAVRMEVMRPVLPMLAATATSVEEAVAALGRCSVEWKLDGARVQVHRRGDEVRIFTRNLNEVTARLPGVVAAVRAMPAQELVLDGEALGLGDDERPRAFQDTMSTFGTSSTGGAPGGLVARFFDLLQVDGEDLLEEPLEARLARLEQVVGPLRVPGVITDDPAEAAALADAALGAGHEGVMVKAAGSTYEAGRRGSSWRKVKPVRTLDLVVLAAEWGSGRRRGWLSNLHLGARGPDGGFVMVGKTFKGLTDALLAWQTEQLQARAVRSTDWVVEVRPELVVEIALDGVQASRRYPGGVALRFARVRGYRPDKGPAEADTIEAVQAMLPGRG